MGTEFFINQSLAITNVFYKVFGIKFTNYFINKSVGNLFTSGESLQTLLDDMKVFENKNINCISSYAVEGLPTYDKSKIEFFYQQMMTTIDSLTESGKEGNFAFKFTGLISTDIITKLSTAQDFCLYDILKINSLETSSCTISFEDFE